MFTPSRKNLCCASCATMPELPTPKNSMRCLVLCVCASASTHARWQNVDASLRYFRNAATVLSITLTTMSPTLSSRVHAAMDEGHALTHGAGQLEFEIDSPS